MFNLLVKGTAWAPGRDSIPESRLFEHTADALIDRFRVAEKVDFDALLRLPAVFIQESLGSASDKAARVGSIIRVRSANRELNLEFVYDTSVPGFTNEDLEAVALELGIDSWEFSRVHWAVKDADLFHSLMRQLLPRRRMPRVFTLAEPERLEAKLVSLMMPFDSSFSDVAVTLRGAVQKAGLLCRRADDIWENPSVIQDVVSLIDRSRAVICDCTGRNPNVFYETGIAHTLGREVILIAQSEADMPFDLRHLRFVVYSKDGAGLEELGRRIASRLSDLTGG
jgi:hypothetical protein